jgi:RNA polymerase sigma-70 factor (ECF subfamily)
MPEPTDVASALEEIAQGRTEAFGRVVRVYALPLRSYLASQVQCLDDVDDLAQEVFLTALRKLSTYRREEDFGAWLRGIARNKLFYYFRSKSRRNQAMQRFRAEALRMVDSDLELAAASDRTEAIECLLRCIARLPEPLRRVVRSGLDGVRPAELAREMCTTVRAIYNLHYRARQLLRDSLQKELG